MVPFPEPEVVTVHQLWSLEAVHAEFEVTVKEVEPAAEVTFWFEGVIFQEIASQVLVGSTGLENNSLGLSNKEPLQREAPQSPNYLTVVPRESFPTNTPPPREFVAREIQVCSFSSPTLT